MLSKEALDVKGKLFKSLLLLGLFLYMIYVFLMTSSQSSPGLLITRELNWFHSCRHHHHLNSETVTDMSHLVFGIAGASNTWGNKRWYIESWWRPNITRGYLFLDRPPIEHLPWPHTSPPIRIYGDTSRYEAYNKHRMPFAIRMVRVIEETFRASPSSTRWFIMADDDTVFIIENLLEVLKGYDHSKYLYIGVNSECVISNADNSFEMGFGGAGYALSYPLAKAVSQNLDLCIKRYPHLYGSDHILQSCVADLGVSLTRHTGFHQIDLHRDIWGILSAHPQAPLVSLHHLDGVEPIFPTMNRYEAVKQLMKAARVDASRLLQQSICYHRPRNWTLSVSWGYSVQIYENILPPSYLHRPAETFIEWRRGARPPYMFNTRRNPFGDPCEAPHVFFFHEDSTTTSSTGSRRSNYIRKYPRRLQPCGNHSADGISRVEVHSPFPKLQVGNGNRRECCDVEEGPVVVKLRACINDEIVS